MAACPVCGTSVRDGASHCTTCGTPTGYTAPQPPAAAEPVVSPPSPFEDHERWLDPAPALPRGESWAPAGPVQAAGQPTRAPRSKTNLLVLLVLAAVVAAVVAVVAVPRLFPSVDPQKFVGTWSFVANPSDTLTITRDGKEFTLDFVGSTGTHQTLPGVLKGRELEIDYDRMGLQGAVLKKLFTQVGDKLSFTYRGSDDRLLLTGSDPSQASVTLVLQRSL